MPEILVIKGLTSHAVYFKKNQIFFRIPPSNSPEALGYQIMA